MTPRTKPEKITIREVAAHAGVAVMTVSRVMRNEPHVAQDTREAVLKSIQALGYRPLHSARSLAASVARVIGLVVPHKTTDFASKAGYEYLSALQMGALSVCLERGYTLMMVKGHQTETTAEELIDLVKSRQVGGYVIPAPATEIVGLLDALTAAEVPFSAISPLRMDKAQRWVAANEHAASSALTQHLIDQGHQRIAFAGGGAVRAGVERQGGFRAAMATAGLKVPARWYSDNGLVFESGLSAGNTLFADRRQRPTAVVCASDDVAAGVIAAAHCCGLRVPVDLSVVGFDNSGLSRKLWPALTTANLPVEEMTAMAVKQLVAALEPAGQPAPATSLVDCDLVMRQSVVPPGTSPS